MAVIRMISGFSAWPKPLPRCWTKPFWAQERQRAKKFEKGVAFSGEVCYNILRQDFGGIAQLGERLNGIQEVSGSIPLISTIKPCSRTGMQGFIFSCFLIGLQQKEWMMKWK